MKGILAIEYLCLATVAVIWQFQRPCDGASFTEKLAPSSLYYESDYTVILTAENIRENIKDSSYMWMVQFYNSWCGHCMRFAPFWKQLAADASNWFDLIRLGVINCANPLNSQICRDYSVKSYPTIRFFPINNQVYKDNPDITIFRPSNRHNQSILHLDFLDHIENMSVIFAMPPKWPMMRPVSMTRIPWVASNFASQMLILESHQSSLGRNLMLDLHNQSTIFVHRVTMHCLENCLDLIDVETIEEFHTIPIFNRSRIGIYSSVQDYYLQNRSRTIADLHLVGNVTADPSGKQMQTEVNRRLVHQVFRDDIEAALAFSLTQDVAQKYLISERSFDSLISYLQVLERYFPFATPEENFLPSLLMTLKLNRTVYLTGEDFHRMVESHAGPFLSRFKNWVGCKGSRPDRRGYSCGLWMLFHTLTIRKYMSPAGTTPVVNNITGEPEVLTAIKGYIQHFFGCSECARHFLQMADQSMKGNVSSGADEIFWLWRAHNNVNLRLANDYTEDSAFPKQLFPHLKICNKCYFINGTWNEPVVLDFLIKMYNTAWDESMTPTVLAWSNSINNAVDQIQTSSSIILKFALVSVGLVALAFFSFRRNRKSVIYSTY